MDEALIEHPQHDVDGHDRRQDQPDLVVQRSLEGVGGAQEHGGERGGDAEVLLGLVDLADRRAQGHPRRGVEGDVGGRELADVVDLQRPGLHAHRGEGRERDRPARAGLHVDVVQALGGPHHGGVGFQDHPVLAGLGEDGRDDPLSEGVIKGLVDGLGGDAEARGGVPVHVYIGREALALDVGGDVAQLLEGRQPRDDLPGPAVHRSLVGALQRELVLGAACGGVDGQVLDRHDVEAHPGHVPGAPAQLVQDLGLRTAALSRGLQVDQHPSLVEGGVGAVHADEGGDAVDVRVGQQRGGELLLQLAHAAVGDRLTGVHHRLDHAGVLGGE